MDEKAKAGLVLGSGVALATAITILASRKAEAAPGEIVALDEASLNLLLAIAQAGADQAELLQQAVAALEALSIDVQGYVPNAKGIIATRIQITALVRPFNLPDIEVPDDMALLIKGWPTNGGLIYVSDTSPGSTNVNQVWPLLANEFVGYRVKNANAIWISGTQLGDWAVMTVERRG